MIKLQEKMKDLHQMMVEIQVSLLRMAREQDRQGRILSNLQNFLMDSHANPIVIEESSQAMDSEEEEPLEEPQENQEEEHPLPNPNVHMDEGDGVICIGEVLF